MAIAGGHGFPVACDVASASPHETKLVEGTLQHRFTRAWPERMIGDTAYDSDPLDRQLWREHRIDHQAVEFGPGVLRTRHAHVHVLADNPPTTTVGVLVQLAQLHLWVLAGGADAAIEGNTRDALGMCGCLRGRTVRASFFASHRCLHTRRRWLG